MLAGEAVVAIWNGVAEEGWAMNYAWHIQEHMSERVGILGFNRGRRFRGIDATTHPALFTLYEVDTMQVLQGQDYTNRLNAPTPWTRAAGKHSRDTSRGLARVVASHGPGVGGVMATIRFDADASAETALAALVREAAGAPRVTGSHLGVADAAASGVVTEEKRNRPDIGAPPGWFILLEATDAEALAPLLPDAALLAAGARGPVRRGVYRLEYLRTKTAWAP
ncbi:hypothetical protein GCM10011504_49700 [Siccirubricoccus deserti]|uniref:Uncharacterized protein n=1 Tax=Siccirubricoccus deserti TaxID=2013562 RepID=A0A9X0R2B9_9PROT|nr:hypothetical protein [Siccirubricoccus deserti]MBC4018486.1 hypothetical protein [Siccirubricoccus deserti]GGC65797.1 hypothetical protein GCM10011504_49700 [Siccirubricoccus deserti]